MHTFKDAKGDEWVIELDIAITRDIRKQLGVDLLTLDKDTIAKLTGEDSESIEKLVDVISLICTEQIKRKDMDARGFASRLNGDVLDDAWDALKEELVFISRRNRKEVVAKALEKTREMEDRVTAKRLEWLESGMVEQKMDQLIQEVESKLGEL